MLNLVRKLGSALSLCFFISSPVLVNASIRPRWAPAMHAQFGGMGGLAGGKILQEFHLPSSPNDLLQFLLEYSLKQKLGNTLPLNLNANDAYPTVDNGQLPGGAFHGRPLTATVTNLHTALGPGDYVVPVMAYCTQYSVHRPGQGTAYKLAPVEGTQAEAISTLLWRGTLAGKSPQELQATNWAIQAGVTYDTMPKPYQALIDQLIPEYRSGLRGNMLDVIQSTYKEVTTDPRKALQIYIKQKYNKTVPVMLLPKITVPAPPLDVVLAKMGPPGELLLDAKKQSDIMLTAYTTKEHGEQVLFQGQGERLPPEPAGEGPWTVRIPGQAYMRFIIQGGNMQGNNLMQIRILPGTGAAEAQRVAHLQLASYPVASTPGASSVAPTSVDGLLGVKTSETATTLSGVQSLTSIGVIGYAVGGGGSQALMAVADRPIVSDPMSCLKKLLYQPFYYKGQAGSASTWAQTHRSARLPLRTSTGFRVTRLTSKISNLRARRGHPTRMPAPMRVLCLRLVSYIVPTATLTSFGSRTLVRGQTST